MITVKQCLKKSNLEKNWGQTAFQREHTEEHFEEGSHFAPQKNTRGVNKLRRK